MDNLEILVVSIFVALVVKIFWGAVTNKVATDKGYSDIWFLWGFIFGI